MVGALISKRNDALALGLLDVVRHFDRELQEYGYWPKPLTRQTSKGLKGILRNVETVMFDWDSLTVSSVFEGR